MAGWTNSVGAGNSDFYTYEIDTDGQFITNHVYGGTGQDRCNAIIETSDGNLVLVGFTYSFGAGLSDGWIIKTDPIGDPIWSWVFGGPSADVGYDVIEGEDGCLYVTGTTSSYGAGSDDAFLVRFAGDGSTCLGYELNFGGSSASSPSSDPMTAQRWDSFEHSSVHMPQQEVELVTTTCTGPVITAGQETRGAVSITPTTTVICTGE